MARKINKKEIRTKLISKSFIDEKEIKKEYLRKKIENKENNLNQTKIDLFYERARMKNAKLEQAQDAIKPMIEDSDRKNEKEIYLKKFINKNQLKGKENWKLELLNKYEKDFSIQENSINVMRKEYNFREMNRSFEISLREYLPKGIEKCKRN